MANTSVSKELDNYEYKFKMNFVILADPLKHFFSKNKNVIGYMQEPNRTLLPKTGKSAKLYVKLPERKN